MKILMSSTSILRATIPRLRLHIRTFTTFWDKGIGGNKNRGIGGNKGIGLWAENRGNKMSLRKTKTLETAEIIFYIDLVLKKYQFDIGIDWKIPIRETPTTRQWCSIALREGCAPEQELKQLNDFLRETTKLSQEKDLSSFYQRN